MTSSASNAHVESAQWAMPNRDAIFTFAVDMNLQGVTGDVKVRTSTVNGDYSPSDWFVMDDADGDLVYNINWTPGKSLGWIYYGAVWKEFGLTDTGEINIDTFNNTQHIGIGTAAVSGFRVGMLGNAKVDGDLVVTGRGGVGADKYITKSYTGDGTTLTFAVTTYSGTIKHSDDSLLVFLNGVAQIAGTNYTVDSNGANVVFSSGDAPLASDTVHILELPI